MAIFSSDLENRYLKGETELNKLKYKGNMGGNHPGSPPLIQKRVPNENKDASPLVGTGISRRADDLGRIAQLFSRREGLGFLSNNTTLNLTIPQSFQNRGADSLRGATTNLKNSFAASALALPNAIRDTALTLASTLASIPVAGTGTHFVKGNLSQQAYLQKQFVNPPNSEVKSPLQKTQTSLPDPQIKGYFYTDARQTNVPNGLSATTDWMEKPEDFQDRKSSTKTAATINLGDPGVSKVKYDKDGNFYKSPSAVSSRDKINLKEPVDYTRAEDRNKLPTDRDYISFAFEILPVQTDSNSKFLQFRAFLDSFDDSYSGNWNSYNYVGRGEPFYTYQGFGRSINVSFKSAVMTREELSPVYRKLNLLASTTAPTYSGNGIMRGTVVRMTIGNYIFDTPGIINTVSYSWNTTYPWEIGTEGENDPRYKQLPHVLDCTLSFTPIHSFVPQTLLETYIATDETI